MLTVRSATQDDAAAIARVHVTGWRTAYRGFVPQGHLDAIDETARAQRWRELLEEQAGSTFVVENGVVENGAVENGAVEKQRDVVGFGAAGASPRPGAGPDEGFVYAVYVLPEAWGTGAAQLLMGALEGALTDAGFATARLDTIAGNARARRFYEKAGWRTDGQENAHPSQQPGMPTPVVLTSVAYTKILTVGAQATRSSSGAAVRP